MRKLVLLVAAAAIAALPAIADAKAKKKDSDPNEPGRRVIMNGVGSFFMPFMQSAPPAKKMHHKHHKMPHAKKPKSKKK